MRTRRPLFFLFVWRNVLRVVPDEHRDPVVIRFYQGFFAGHLVSWRLEQVVDEFVVLIYLKGRYRILTKWPHRRAKIEVSSEMNWWKSDKPLQNWKVVCIDRISACSSSGIPNQVWCDKKAEKFKIVGLRKLLVFAWFEEFVFVRLVNSYCRISAMCCSLKAAIPHRFKRSSQHELTCESKPLL